MRLGSYDCSLEPKSIAYKAYGRKKIEERHRHRYEFNNTYKDVLAKAGLNITGTNPQTGLAEIVELEGHPYFLGAQFHPELKSTVETPHPLFVSFTKATLDYSKKREKNVASKKSSVEVNS